MAVIGAGTLGHGITQVAADAGCGVLLRDVESQSLANDTEVLEQLCCKQ